MGNYFKKMSNKIKDESFTIVLPGSNIIFTRYLYLKDEVKLALLISLLKKSDDAIFWAYELYYSGFKMELIEFIWKIYYEFFATLNPSFEAYLLNKFSKNKQITDDKLVSAIIQDLLIRPFNTDVFFLNIICRTFEIECNYKNKNINGNINGNTKKTKIMSTNDLLEQLMLWIDAHDYKSIAQFILHDKKLSKNSNPDFTNEYIYGYVIDAFDKLYGLNMAKKRLLKEFNNGDKSDLVLLTKIMTLFSIKEKLIKGKNFYITINPEDIIQYETIEVTKDGVRAYRILQTACICGIDDLKHLALFKLERDKVENLVDLYNNHWLYHAAFSPVWFNRIKEHMGYVDYKNQNVEFVDEDQCQLFYSKYGYEPDEQPTNVKEKSIMEIEIATDWETFYSKFGQNRLFKLDEDELTELNMDRIHFHL
jgi:hypothetical protein